jgi:hypothetical protein
MVFGLLTLFGLTIREHMQKFCGTFLKAEPSLSLSCGLGGKIGL